MAQGLMQTPRAIRAMAPARLKAASRSPLLSRLIIAVRRILALRAAASSLIVSTSQGCCG
jgi:hypothetical protein